eukprot:TRINITY_DN34293_c0_g1_i1.p1 TRINITY_DN34293_c0_g1~~TRINITY_DN34293_c0_g1_i1.p1  ORF type:complete len:540 (-),score=40.66 TRINITY_DN34293_c0_g1_i1:174-1736(-)
MAISSHPAVTLLSQTETEGFSRLSQAFQILHGSENPPNPSLSIVGLGDHATGTLDAVLMVRRAMLAAVPETKLRLAMHGLACPEAEAGRHHCRLRCQVVGDCGVSVDALSEWIGEYIFDSPEGGRTYSLGVAGWWGEEVMRDPAAIALQSSLKTLDSLAAADLIVCSHPVAFCLLSFWALWHPEVVKSNRGSPTPESSLRGVPMLLHLASTLLYGAPGCSTCVGKLRRYETSGGRTFLRLARDLLAGPLPLVALTEGAMISAQIQDQIGALIPSVPALALYLDDTNYLRDLRRGVFEEKRPTILVTRARFFSHPVGLMLKSLMSEFAVSNHPEADGERGHFWFSEVPTSTSDQKSGDTWKSWDEMSKCTAAFFIPSDLHQRTFIELYRMSVPTFMPDANWLIRIPLTAPFGVFSYEGSLPKDERLNEGDRDEDGRSVPSSFDVEHVSATVMFHWYHYSDYAHFPHIGHCHSIPDLLHKLASTDLQERALQMQQHYELLARGATAAFAKATALLISSSKMS